MLALVRGSALVRLARWVRAWMFPVRGWADVVRKYADGERSWPVPGRPDVLPQMPWPVPWTLARVLAPGEPDPRGHGYVNVDEVSAPSGLLARASELGARCARCGSALAHRDLALEEPPACRLCASAVLRAARGAR